MSEEDSVATQRIIELAQENELLLQDVEEYRRNEDDYIAKITALQKYVTNYKTSQKKVEEQTGIIAVLETEKGALTDRVAELEARLNDMEVAAEEASKSHAATVAAMKADHTNAVEEQRAELLASFESLNEIHAAELKQMEEKLAAASTVQTVDQYFEKIGAEIQDVLGGYELYMKNMRNNVSYEGLHWPLDSTSISWGELPIPTLIKKAPDAGHSGVVSMVSFAQKQSLSVFDTDGSSEAAASHQNPIKMLIVALMDAELQLAFYYVTLQKLASASIPASGDGSTKRSGVSSSTSHAGGGSSQGGGSAPSTSRSGTSGKGLSLWA